MPTRNNLRAKRRMALWGALLVLLLVWAAAAPSLTPNDPYLVDLSIAKLPPGGSYPMGTDSLGRCLLSRIMAGAPATLFYSLLVVAVTAVAGSLLGVFCGYFGGALDTVVMGLADIRTLPLAALAAAQLALLLRRAQREDACAFHKSIKNRTHR